MALFVALRSTLVNIRSGSKPLIKVVLKPKTKMCSCLRTTFIIYFDPLQMLTTPYAGELLNVDAITLKKGVLDLLSDSFHSEISSQFHE